MVNPDVRCSSISSLNLSSFSMSFLLRKIKAQLGEGNTGEADGLQMDQVGIPHQLHFLFPNGIQVMCPESVQPEVLRTLLNP